MLVETGGYSDVGFAVVVDGEQSSCSDPSVLKLVKHSLSLDGGIVEIQSRRPAATVAVVVDALGTAGNSPGVAEYSA